MKTYSLSERRKPGDVKRGLFKTNTLRSPLSTPTKKKRRDREQFYAAQQLQAESFVVKLFDRSLDLSKYTDKTPLYPICRAWMANQPRSINLPNLKNQTEREIVRRQNNGAELLRRIQKGEPISVTGMPAPLNIEVSTATDTDERAKPDLKALDEALITQKADKVVAYDEIRNELMAEHKLKWKTQKSKSTMRGQDKRYELNQLIIKKLYRN